MYKEDLMTVHVNLAGKAAHSVCHAWDLWQGSCSSQPCLVISHAVVEGRLCGVWQLILSVCFPLHEI